MKTSFTLKTALKSLNANKLRSALTILGVIIGVFAVVSMISLGRGLQNYITDQFNELGSNLLFVVPGNIESTGFGSNDPAAYFSRNKLEEKHVDLIKTNMGDYQIEISPHISIGEEVEYKTKTYQTTVEAVSYEAEDIFAYKVSVGRFFNRVEQKTREKVVILGPLVKEEFFPNKNPLGSKIEVGGDKYEVIGVFEKKGRTYDKGIIIPYTSAKETFGIQNVTDISIKVLNNSDLSGIKRQLKQTLLRELKGDDFSIMSQEDILSSINNILRMLTIGLGAIAAVSLLVGGIGIMNIMFVSVTERTREIGLRKAVGATPFVIGIQFLMESTFLSLAGGVVGLLLGYLASYIAREYIGLRTEIPWWAVVLSFGFSALVGIVFGTYPALKASKKDPIEALRYE